MKAQPDIKVRDLVFYSILALPLAFAGMPLYLYAPDFYAVEHGLSLSVIGSLLLLVRGVDAVQDPLIGWLSDRYAAHRQVIMAAGILLMGISFFALFHPLTDYLMLWFSGSMLLLTTAFSILSINLNTLGGLWTRDTHDKTRITAFREAFGLGGVILASALPVYFLTSYDYAQSFHFLSLVFLGVLLISSLLFMGWIFGFSFVGASSDSPGATLSGFWRQATAGVKRFYAVYFLSMLSSAVPVVVVIFFVRDRLEAESYLGLFLAVYFVSGALGMPVWQWLARRRGKVLSWTVAMLLAIVSFAWAWFLDAGDVLPYFLICAVSGFALGAELSLPPSILSDLIDRDGSHDRAAVQFSIQTFISKFALALATGIALPSLHFMGYDPSNLGACCTQTVQDSLSMIYAIVPCVIKYIALRCLWTWRTQIQGDHLENNQSITYGGAYHA